MVVLRALILLITLCLLQSPAWGQATQEFPELTGRVVDGAGMLSQDEASALTEMLAAHEEATTNQVVVVTLPDLQGYPIEEFGYQLGRHWGIGQKGEDNGALLIVAEEERAIRIEVGYGLEGRLTDATSSAIINQVITPAFRQGEFARGITDGTEAMIQALGGESVAVPGGEAAPGDKPNLLAVIFFFIIIVSFISLVGGGGRGGRGRGALAAGALLGAGMGGRGGGFGGGGFSGGGGGFGGGGASGGW
ncbi:TPM domain-containing protein [Marinobacter segnicrescens]|uniref:TPM domain-containing protein n=1 Tax=Marinobacter segnicrescens TaxID=430453 RepID=UPI003A924AE2